MAYDEKLAQRVRALVGARKGFSEKKMFGGVAFLIDGKMCCGVLKDDLVARISVKDHEDALNKPHVRPMDFTGRPMRGYVYVEPAALRSTRSLEAWLEKSVAFTATLPANKSKKR